MNSDDLYDLYLKALFEAQRTCDLADWVRAGTACSDWKRECRREKDDALKPEQEDLWAEDQAIIDDETLIINQTGTP